MISLPLFLILAASFGSGSSSTAPTQPLPGPAAPQQTVIPPSTTTQPTPKPSVTQPSINRELLEQRRKEREAESSAQGPLYIFPGVVRQKTVNGWDLIIFTI